MKAGDSLLITGGAGGLGTLTIQIAKNVFGAGLVVTTASAGEKTDLITSLGADQVVDYRSTKFEEVLEEKSFDACFDTTGESLKCAKLIKKGGMVVTIAGNPTTKSAVLAAIVRWGAGRWRRTQVSTRALLRGRRPWGWTRGSSRGCGLPGWRTGRWSCSAGEGAGRPSGGEWTARGGQL